MLGPRSRYDKLLAGLPPQGYVPDPSRPRACEARWGSRWGLRRRKKWRLSILGEILAIRRGFDGGFLSGSVGSLHRPEDSRLLASS